MKKSLFFVAAASALMLTACSSDNEATQSAPQQQSGPQAVAFDTYVPNTTRAGETGVMTTTTLKTTGFGVFAQYSNGSGSTDGAYNNDPDATSHTIPVANFMYNQEVTYSSAAWAYSPLKYWPNETDNDSQGGTDGNATSTHADKLSFFAYAPYVSAGSGTAGITSMIANTAYGADPWVQYSVATTPTESVDLLWGVAPSGGLSYTNVAGGTTTVTKGMPLVDLIKPKKDEKIKFLFQHALARLGLTVVAAFDQIAPGGEPSNTTKIAVKSVVITETTNDGATPTPTPQLKTSGKLNLKNTTSFQSLWSETSGTINFTIDGANLNPDIAYKTNTATTYTDVAGVTTTEKKVIAPTVTPAHDNYFMVIPNHADTQLQVVITYDVITADANLKGGYSEVENVITKKVTIPTLTNNKAYNLKLVLGLTSVKLDAEVAEWKTDGGTETYLPQNVE